MSESFRLEHYIVKAIKHAVFRPFSNEAREKSSISGPKARERFEKSTKKRRNRAFLSSWAA
jgi:hypothetical protein